ncbi:MAG: hypothetical protein KQ78_01552 [Candidatus Izimaplasma bacterium HR2]|nr:MAG: hypothetical protein KQ78_01552 [Candidatus Izimaplasma bacterium HR2]
MDLINSLILGTISGIISGIIVIYLLKKFLLRKNNNLFNESANNLVNITFYILEEYHSYLAAIDKYLKSKEVSDFNCMKSKLIRLIKPMVANEEFTFNSAKYYTSEIRELIYTHSDSKSAVNFFRNEAMISEIHSGVINNVERLYESETAFQWVEISDFFKTNSHQINAHLQFIRSSLVNTCRNLENRISILIRMLNKNIPLNRIVLYSVWQSADPISYDELCNKIKKTFNVFWNDIEFNSVIDEQVVLKHLSLSNGMYSKTGYSGSVRGIGFERIGIKSLSKIDFMK